MAEEDSSKLRIRFNYVEAPSHKWVWGLTGAWGGVTPWGDVQIALYRDRLPLPEAFLRDPETNQETPVQKHKGEEFVVERVVEFGMVLSPEVALKIGEWLVRHAKQVTELTDSQEKADE